MIRLSKYEFNSREQALEKLATIGYKIDTNSNQYSENNHEVVEFGHILLKRPIFDDAGVEIFPPVYSLKYHVDICWDEKEITNDAGAVTHPYGFKSYSANCDGIGMHNFFELNYEKWKL